MRMCRTTTEHYAACKGDYQGESNQYRKDALAIYKSTHKKTSPKTYVSPASYAFVARLCSSKCSHLLDNRTQTHGTGRNSNKNRYRDTRRYTTNPSPVVNIGSSLYN